MRKCRRTCSLPARARRRACSGSARRDHAGLGALARRRDEPARLTVDDLIDDPARLAADGRPSLPERLAHRQAEAFPDRLLDHRGGVDLERVHLDRAHVVQVREDVDVRVARGVGDGLVVELPALRVVVRHRADERELDVRMLLLHEPVRVDHAERVLPRVEPRDLREQRPRDVDPELVDDVRGVLGRQRHVLRRERVDRRRPDERALGQFGRHVVASVEDRRRVAPDRREQELEHLPVRRREVDVAAPDPVRARRREPVDHRARLRVVDDHEVVLVDELLRVQLVVAPVDRLSLVVQALRVALERVVNRLRDVEELVRAADDQPVRLEARALHQRHERVVDLRDAATERCRRNVGDPLAGQRLGQPADLVHQPTRGDGRVVRELLVSDVDRLEHGGETSRGAGSTVEHLDEAQPRTPAALARADLDVVGDRADDRDPETAFDELVARSSPADSDGSKPAPSSATSITSRSWCSS